MSISELLTVQVVDVFPIPDAQNFLAESQSAFLPQAAADSNIPLSYVEIA